MDTFNSDKFLDMPFSAQALYFHLLMRINDDGCLNNSKAITRSIGASNSDFNLLLENKLIKLIPTENGVVCEVC